MAGYLSAVYYVRKVRNALRREQVFRDRLNPFDRYDDIELIKAQVQVYKRIGDFLK